MGFSQIRVTGDWPGEDNGRRRRGEVYLHLSRPMVNGDERVEAPQWWRILVHDGVGEVTVPANDDPETSPGHAGYFVEERVWGLPVGSFFTVVPHGAPGGTISIEDLRRWVAPPPPAREPSPPRTGPIPYPELSPSGEPVGPSAPADSSADTIQAE